MYKIYSLVVKLRGAAENSVMRMQWRFIIIRFHSQMRSPLECTNFDLELAHQCNYGHCFLIFLLRKN